VPRELLRRGRGGAGGGRRGRERRGASRRFWEGRGGGAAAAAPWLRCLFPSLACCAGFWEGSRGFMNARAHFQRKVLFQPCDAG
jgi:hypothetical protein